MNSEIPKVMKESMVILLEIKQIDAKYKRLNFSIMFNNSYSNEIIHNELKDVDKIFCFL